MVSTKHLCLGIFMLGFANTSFAQQPASKRNVKIVPAAVVTVDSTATEMETVEQVLEMEASEEPAKNFFVLNGTSKKFNLNDHPDAAKYDSLWIKEIHASASLFDSI